MFDDAGVVVTDAILLDRVLATGGVVVRRGPVESLDFATWRRELRRAAKERSRRISVNRLDESVVVVSDPDYVVDPAQLRAAVEAIPVPPGVELPAPATRRSRRWLGVVDDPDDQASF